jgi:Glyoxalase-like domain
MAITRLGSWPDGGLPKQIHLDLAADDLDDAEAEAVRLGAREARAELAAYLVDAENLVVKAIQG